MIHISIYFALKAILWLTIQLLPKKVESVFKDENNELEKKVSDLEQSDQAKPRSAKNIQSSLKIEEIEENMNQEM